MKFMKNLQRRFARFGGIPNLMIYVTGTMLVLYFLPAFTGNDVTPLLHLSRDAVLRGQIWRLVTFIFIPEYYTSPFSLLLSLYFMYWVGNSLEEYWGSGSFTFYYLCGMIGAIISAAISGWGTASYLHLSLFLAFAYLFPEMQIMLMFVFPIKVKYLGYIAWLMFFLSFISTNWPGRVALLASIINFMLFFGEDFISWVRNQIRYGKQRRNWRQSMRGRDNWYK